MKRSDVQPRSEPLLSNRKTAYSHHTGEISVATPTCCCCCCCLATVAGSLSYMSTNAALTAKENTRPLWGAFAMLPAIAISLSIWSAIVLESLLPIGIALPVLIVAIRRAAGDDIATGIVHVLGMAFLLFLGTVAEVILILGLGSVASGNSNAIAIAIGVSWVALAIAAAIFAVQVARSQFR